MKKYKYLIVITCLLAFGAGAPASVFAGVYEDILAAAANGRLDEVRSLLQRGLDINTTDRDGATLLMLAARSGNTELADYLIANRASVARPNRFGDTPLHLAASEGHQSMVVRLLEAGAPVEFKGWTPLQYAVFGGHVAIAKALLARGSLIEHRAPNGKTALMLAAMLGNRQMVELLLAAGGDPAAEDYEGLDAADLAEQKGFGELAVRLAEAQVKR